MRLNPLTVGLIGDMAVGKWMGGQDLGGWGKSWRTLEMVGARLNYHFFSIDLSEEFY